MIAWLLVGIWNVASLTVMFGPLVLALIIWERRDSSRDRVALEQGLPQPRNPPQVTALRFAIGLGLFLVFGYLASIMYEASGALYGAINSRAAF